MKHDELDDGQLLTLISERNRDALERLYGRYGGGVFSLAMHLLRDSGAAEEVTQDVFFNVWRRSSSYSAERGTVTAWLFSIAHHRAIDELRRRQRRQTRIQPGVDPVEMPSGEGSDPLEFTTSQFESGRLKDALEDLRPEQREVVILAYFSGLTQSEIAMRLGHPLGTVKTRTRLALKRLREVLGPQIKESAEHGV